jgi:hypothetical protein
VAGSYEYVNGTFGFIKSGEICGCLNNYYLLKKGSALWNLIKVKWFAAEQN